MVSNLGYQAPRSDLTVRGVPHDKMEELCNAIVDILGGRVEFSESAIYESEQEEPKAYGLNEEESKVPVAQCSSRNMHHAHIWFDDGVGKACTGRLVKDVVLRPCARLTEHPPHRWGTLEEPLKCNGLPIAPRRSSG